MSFDNIDFYYFSGTGNTLLVVKKMRDTFEKNGINVNLHKIEESNPKEVNLEHTIGIAFPVAVFSTYPFVWDFINALPHADGTEIFMVDTLGGTSGGIVGPLHKTVKKKGYTPVGAKEIVMPLNIFFIADGKVNKDKVKKGIKAAEKYALDIINGNSKWNRVPVLSDAVRIVSTGTLKLTDVKLSQRIFHFEADEGKCNKCRICVDLCPVENIKIEGDEYPVHGLNCEYCLRCVSLCPMNATPAKLNYKGKIHQAVKANELLK